MLMERMLKTSELVGDFVKRKNEMYRRTEESVCGMMSLER